MLQWISALPDNVVNNIFTTINTLICGKRSIGGTLVDLPIFLDN